MWQYSLSRRPGASGSSSTQQKTKAAGSKPNFGSTTGQPRGNIIQNQKANKNWYYRGSYSGRTTRGGFRPQVTQTAPPPPRVVPINPGPQRGGGPGPRRGGQGNQQRPRAAGVRAIPEDQSDGAGGDGWPARPGFGSAPREERIPMFPRVNVRETRLPPLWQPRYTLGGDGNKIARDPVSQRIRICESRQKKAPEEKAEVDEVG